MLEAVVFDFDGLVLDTELPLFEAWRLTFVHHGVEPIGLEQWCVSLGRHDADPLRLDPLAILEDALGHPVDRPTVEAARRRRRNELIDAEDVLPGVERLLDEAEASGLPTAIASSSPPDWIETHLGARGLLDRFDAISCAGEGAPGKPDPATYLTACARLGVDPRCSLALEDSPNGVTAAKAAGLHCIAVPGAIGAHLDLSHADRVVGSLLDVDLATVPV
jgi:HAD superfamily hydrolase (TIGR01509 family)